MSDSEAYPIPSPVAPRGVGGWLLFFILTMVLFGPVVYIGSFLRSSPHTMEVFAAGRHPYAHYLFYFVERVVGLSLRGYGIFAGIQLWKTRPGAMLHAKRFLLLLAS